jgi:Domain of unknown function (DUF4126)
VSVLEALTGVGLSASAGLNAWIPLLVLGLLDRFTNLITLPHGWAWLSNGWVLTVLAILLAIEVVADKIPIVDHINDTIHTVIRPTAGGLAFGASSDASTVTVKDPGTFFSSHQWIAVLAGILVALSVHTVKASARPVINVTTAGSGAPVASTVEDILSTVFSLIAIVMPVLVLVFGVLFVFLAWRGISRLRRRRADKRGSKQPMRYAKPDATLRLPATEQPTLRQVPNSADGHNQRMSH